MSDTIFALASGAGLGAISVIRVSGPASDAALLTLCGALPPARRASLRRIRDPRTQALLDHGLVLRFPGPQSFTGEDGFELHIHGGRAVAAGVLAALGLCEGLRLAEPGEFARRAFRNGKLDLTEAEGLADLIEASTAAQRDQALALAGGRLREQAEAWRSAILALQAQTEASIDFSDEGDVPGAVWEDFAAEVRTLAQSMKVALVDGRRGEILRSGFTVVLAGPPNAGKSSLMNALARRDVAIVSAIPGTTRDLIEVSLDLDGMPVVLVDTAGLREASDEVEQEGIRRTRARVAAADLVLWLVAPDQQGGGSALPDAPVVLIATKCDLGPLESEAKPSLSLSARTGQGVDELLALMTERARHALRPEEPALMSRERHRIAIREACAALGQIKQDMPVEVAAEELRTAARALASIIGLVGPEDVLGEIFSRFCIGK